MSHSNPNVTGHLFVVSAPSGAGKTSLLKSLMTHLSQVETSVSHTTRAMRPAEVDGKDYHFVSVDEFKALIKKDAFFEYAEVFDNFYGTSKEAVASQRAAGTDVILEIDWQGARQIRQQIPECISIFILPPSKAELERRLCGRGQDDDSVIARRMAAAQAEMSHYSEYDYLVINDDFEQAVAELVSIIGSQRQTIGWQQKKHAQLLSNLLEQAII